MEFVLTLPATMPPNDPPALTVERALAGWTLDPFLIVPLVVAGGLYLWAVRRLRRRGDGWSALRVWAWFGGLALIFLGTSSALGGYDRVLFQVPAIQHMVLQMVAPVGLVIAAPMTLALRTLPPSPRWALLAVVHRSPLRYLGHPVVAFAVFGVTQFVYYYSPLYVASMTNVWVHDLTHLHFVLVGFLFYWSLLAIDPVPFRVPFFLKFMLVLGMAPLHILLGLPIMMMDSLIAGGYYLGLDRSWGPTPLSDQHIGGAILWGFGDISAGVLVAVFAREWSRSDERAARRTDRMLDRRYGENAMMRPWWLADEAPSAAVGGDGSEQHRGEQGWLGERPEGGCGGGLVGEGVERPGRADVGEPGGGGGGAVDRGRGP